MKALIVLSHPDPDSYCASIARQAVEALDRAGHSVKLIDLYRDGFEACLTLSERQAYYAKAGLPDAPYASYLLEADHLVLVFPQWWFSFPAAMKGFIDRAFAPGVAFDHAHDFGPIQARLTRLKSLTALTTLGSPAWVDWLYMRRPVARVLRRAIVKACAPNARFSMLAHYDVERSTPEARRTFLTRVRIFLGKLPR